MAEIFISYRRQDSDHALSLYLWLIKKYGRGSVFWDQKDIDPGRNFVDVIEKGIDSSSALIALIGKGWLDLTDSQGRRRIDSPDDLLRREIAAALRRGILVLPVLGSGAAMPEPGRLPDDLRGLSHIQALKMTEMRFHPLLAESLAGAGIAEERNTGPAPPEAGIAARAGELLRRQAGRLQVRAKEFLREGKADRATEELNEGVELMIAVLDLVSGEPMVDLELGYMFAALGRQFIDVRDRDRSGRYLDLALSIFYRVKDDLASAEEATAERASAVKGIGEIHYNRGEIEEAIRWYGQALEIEPGYSYAWHDLLGAYDVLASRGRIDVAAMRIALDGMKESSGSGGVYAQPGLDSEYVAGLEARVEHWEKTVAACPHLASGAEEASTKAIAADPDDPEPYFQRARGRSARHRYADAIEDYSAAIARGKSDTPVFRERGGLYLAGGDFAAAEKDFTTALDLGDTQSAIYFYRGRSRLSLNDARGAEGDFSQAIGRGHSGAHFQRGLARLVLEDLSGAESDFSVSIERGEDAAAAHRFRGMVRARTGDHQGATSDLDAAIGKGLAGADVFYELGTQRAILEDFPGSEAAFNSAIELGRDDAPVYLGRATARAQQKDGARAAEDYQAAIDRGAPQPFAHYMLGKMRTWTGDLSGAEQSLTAAIDGGYAEAAAFRLRGAARAELGNHAGAESDYSEAIRLGEAGAEIYVKRATSRMMRMDVAGAEADFTEAIAHGGGMEGLAYHGRALVRNLSRNLKGTFADCSKAIARGTADASLFRIRARAGVRLGHLETAEQDCEKAAQLSPGDPEGETCWGDLHLARRDYANAAARYRSALAAAPDSSGHFALGLTLLLSGRIDEAKAAYAKGLDPLDPSAIAVARDELSLWTRGRQVPPKNKSAIRRMLEEKPAAAGATG